MRAVLVIAGAIGASTGAFTLWNWAVGRTVTRQRARMAEELRQNRGPPVLGGAPRHRRPRGWD